MTTGQAPTTFTDWWMGDHLIFDIALSPIEWVCLAPVEMLNVMMDAEMQEKKVSEIVLH